MPLNNLVKLEMLPSNNLAKLEMFLDIFNSWKLLECYFFLFNVCLIVMLDCFKKKKKVMPDSLYNSSLPFLVELHNKKVLVQHVETISSSEVTLDIVQSFVVSIPSRWHCTILSPYNIQVLSCVYFWIKKSSQANSLSIYNILFQSSQ
jgi:hypothetical protein